MILSFKPVGLLPRTSNPLDLGTELADLETSTRLPLLIAKSPTLEDVFHLRENIRLMSMPQGVAPLEKASGAQRPASAAHLRMRVPIALNCPCNSGFAAFHNFYFLRADCLRTDAVENAFPHPIDESGSMIEGESARLYSAPRRSSRAATIFFVDPVHDVLQANM